MGILSRQDTRKLMELRLDMITPSPFQPRKDFDLYELSRLSQSIRENGVLQPVTVRKTETAYELISGERRYKAASIAGLKTIPAIVITASDRQSSIFGLIENIQRCNLNFFEEAEGIEKLITDHGFSFSDVALCLGIARSTLSNKLRILKLSPNDRRRILSASLTEHHARAFLRLEGEKREEAINLAIASSLTAGETDKLVEAMLETKTPKKPLGRQAVVCDMRLFGNSIDRMVKTFQKQGFDATTTKTEDDTTLQYTITIPKKKV